MPVAQSFYEPGATHRHIRGVDASEYTRYVRLSATVAPYINSSTPIRVPYARLGQPLLNGEARFVSSIFGGLRPFVANK